MIVLKAPQEKVCSEALQSVAGIVERRHTLPILANVLLRKTGEVEFTTSDLEIQVRTRPTLDGDAGNFTTTVGARKLIDILRSLPPTRW
jgi:DNA polymerase-3 subunit beta